MKVTKLTAQQKNQDRVNVFIDGKYELSLTLDEVLEHKVKVGTELDEAGLKNLKKVSEDGKLKARTLEWLLSRPRSKKELKDYLYKKDIEKEQIEVFCDYFIKRGYQNDEQFADWWVEQRLRKNKSDLSMKMELKQKGVPDVIIAKSLQLGIDDKIRLKQLILSKKLQQKYPERQKLIQYLAGKGFNYSDIVEVLDGLSADVDNL